MKSLTTAIYGQLAGSSLYSDIGGRMFKGRAPEGTDFPYVVYFVVSDVTDLTFTENYEDVLIQFSLFSNASSSGEIEDMFAHLKELYDECALTIPAVSHDVAATLVWMKRANVQFMVEDHGTTEVNHYAVDYFVKIKV